MYFTGAAAAGAVIIEVNASWIPSNICLFARLTGAVAGRYNKWMNTSLFDQVRKLPLEEQLELVEALWDSIGDRNPVPSGPRPKRRLTRTFAVSLPIGFHS